MQQPVVVVGLDAAEATLIESWADAGFLPNLARLRREGAACSLANSLTTLPGAIWPELYTGRSCGKFGVFYPPRQFRRGEMRARPLSADDIDGRLSFAGVASQAGRRVAVVDIPDSVLCPGLNGVQVCEWGLHDRHLRVGSDPPALIEELSRQHGTYPVDSCDRLHGGTAAGYRKLRDALIEGVRCKTRLLLDVMGRERWDLFACAFSEAHCAGHQFWHLHDARDPWHDPDTPADLRDALRTVYQSLDDAVGQLVAAVAPGARVIVVASHGMGPKVAGFQLIPEVLERLGLGPSRPLWNRIAPLVPDWLRNAIKRSLPVPIPERYRLGYDARYDSLPAGQKAVPMENICGAAVRLNIVGRDPCGCVHPGAAADALLADLRHELLALRDPRSGEAIITHVRTAAETFGADHHPDLPDLMIAFRRDLGRLEACESPRVGLLRVPWQRKFNPRTGDHGVESRFWAFGPRIPRGVQLPGANVLDLAPTVLRLLDVGVPAGIDGRPLAALVHADRT